MSLAWYAVPAIYVRLTLQKYAQSGGGTYQESVMRKSWSALAILSDWWFNVAASLEFWTWPDGDGRAAPGSIPLLSFLAAAVFLAGGTAIVRLRSRRGETAALVPDQSAWGQLFSVGFVLLVLSFPVYLLLNLSRSLYRTHFLSGIGAGLVLAASVGFVSDRFKDPAARRTTFLGAAAVIVYFGTVAALERGSVQLWQWELHRSAMTQILHVAPRVKQDTVVVLTNVPRATDPFQHNMWLDMGLRLAYLGTRVGGIYFYDDLTPSPGNNIVAAGDEWKWDGTGFPPELRQTKLANTVIVKYEASGPGELLRTFPTFLCHGNCTTASYDPTRAIIAGPVAPRTVRRYRLGSSF
jgi:hypothetical protein